MSIDQANIYIIAAFCLSAGLIVGGIIVARRKNAYLKQLSELADSLDRGAVPSRSFAVGAERRWTISARLIRSAQQFQRQILAADGKASGHRVEADCLTCYAKLLKYQTQTAKSPEDITELSKQGVQALERSALLYDRLPILTEEIDGSGKTIFILAPHLSATQSGELSENVFDNQSDESIPQYEIDLAQLILSIQKIAAIQNDSVKTESPDSMRHHEMRHQNIASEKPITAVESGEMDKEQSPQQVHLLLSFLGECEVILEAIQQSLDTGDWASSQQHVRRLRTLAEDSFAQGISGQALRLESVLSSLIATDDANSRGEGTQVLEFFSDLLGGFEDLQSGLEQRVLEGNFSSP